MNKVPYANTGQHAVHIGPVMIPPGGSRDVDPRDIPGAGKAKPQASAPPPDSIAQLRELSVANIQSQLVGLEDDDLAELLKLEEADKRPRTTLITALREEQLERARAAAEFAEFEGAGEGEGSGEGDSTGTGEGEGSGNGDGTQQ